MEEEISLLTSEDRYLLWAYFTEEHNLTLVESELDDVIYRVEDYILPKNKIVRRLIKFLMKLF